MEHSLLFAKTRFGDLNGNTKEDKGGNQDMKNKNVKLN